MEAASDFAKRMAQTMDETRSALKLAAEDMARFYDQDHREAEVFQPGDKVWLDGRNIKTVRPTKKMDDRWFGPFVIDKAVSRNAYKLKLTHAFAQLYPVFHVSLLRHFQPDQIAERPQHDHPEPELVDGEPEYEVKELLDSKLIRRRLHYLVSFKGYGPEDNQWLPEENLGNAREAIAEFHRLNPSAPRRISAAAMQALMFRKYENLTEVLPPPKPITTISRRVAES